MLSTALRGAVAAAAILAASTAFAGVNLINGRRFLQSEPGRRLLGLLARNQRLDEHDRGRRRDRLFATLRPRPTDNAGGQNLELNANTYGTDSYTVSGLKVGATYDLSWDYGGRTAGGPSSATVSFGGGT